MALSDLLVDVELVEVADLARLLSANPLSPSRRDCAVVCEVAVREAITIGD